MIVLINEEMECCLSFKGYTVYRELFAIVLISPPHSRYRLKNLRFGEFQGLKLSLIN